jgi:hypothetical protein
MLVAVRYLQSDRINLPLKISLNLHVATRPGFPTATLAFPKISSLL